MPRITFLGLKDLNPPQQALVSAALISFFALLCLVAGVRDILAWNILISPVILYTFMNPVLGIFVRDKQLRYIGLSAICFIALGFFAYAAGSLVSRLAFGNTRELVLIAMLIPLFYILSYILSFLFKGVLNFLEEVDN